MWNGIGWYGFIGPTTSTTDISLVKSMNEWFVTGTLTLADKCYSLTKILKKTRYHQDSGTFYRFLDIGTHPSTSPQKEMPSCTKGSKHVSKHLQRRSMSSSKDKI